MPDFDIGDYLVYPEHGAGQIEETVEETIDEEEQTYFVISTLMDNITVKVPIDRVPDHARSVYSKSTILKRFREMRSFLEEQAESEDLYKINRPHLEDLQETIRQEADIDAVVEALMKLRPRYEARDMNIGEKQTYDLAERFCLTELMAVYDCSEEEARQKLLEYMPSQES